MVDYKEYTEDGVIFQALHAPQMPIEQYQDAHQSLVIFCHDIFVEYQGGILLIIRNNHPAKDVFWPLGGRVLRGVDVIESAKRKVKKESNLELHDVRFLGMARTYFPTDPFGHGHGTDSVNAVLFAKGKGDLILDHQHEKPSVIKPADCTDTFMDGLEPYVRDYLSLSMKMIQ